MVFDSRLNTDEDKRLLQELKSMGEEQLLKFWNGWEQTRRALVKREEEIIQRAKSLGLFGGEEQKKEAGEAKEEEGEEVKKD